MRRASGVIKGVTAIMPAAAGSVASPAWNASSPSAAGFWKYRLRTYISALIVPATIRIASVEPTSTRVAQQLQVDQRRGGAPLDDDEQRRRRDPDDEAPDRLDRRPAPVVALAEPEHDRGQRERDQHRAGPVDRARPRPGRATPGRSPPSVGCTAPAIPAVIQNRPCQPVESTSRPPTSGPAAPPAADSAPQQRDRLHLAGAGRGDREQAHAAGQDRRAGGALDHPPADDARRRWSRARSARTRR